MQSAAFRLSSTLPSLKPRSLLMSPRCDPIRVSCSSTPKLRDLTASNNAVSANFARRSWNLSSSPLGLRPWASVLKVHPFPITITMIQFAVGALLVTLMWTLNLYKRPKDSVAQLAAILPLAVVHALGNLFTNMSIGKVAVSFTHTIKAMEPFFSVVLSAMFLGEIASPWVVASLLPIVGGVALASATEAVRPLSIVAIFMEGVKFTPAYLQSAVSYMILQWVSPVTHSVGNCVKQVVVIVSSIFFFRTPVSPVNCLGTGLALAGVFLYSRVKRIKSKPKTKTA
ncbi:hypothetical protein HS088_TW19G00459 [Tripterygium wilfordii]|uniref:Sugar phosphate transporter domain-containing protein n=1 Tax=Tripterygium wilfordii TaxID=458696 RepID=A0A7J7C9R6_TRIWF|nr:hypothetical protein HS088_TW19G00459 [Tripterygium wilfordii]